MQRWQNFPRKLLSGKVGKVLPGQCVMTWQSCQLAKSCPFNVSLGMKLSVMHCKSCLLIKLAHSKVCTWHSCHIAKLSHCKVVTWQSCHIAKVISWQKLSHGEVITWQSYTWQSFHIAKVVTWQSGHIAKVVTLQHANRHMKHFLQLDCYNCGIEDGIKTILCVAVIIRE